MNRYERYLDGIEARRSMAARERAGIVDQRRRASRALARMETAIAHLRDIMASLDDVPGDDDDAITALMECHNQVTWIADEATACERAVSRARSDCALERSSYQSQWS